MNLTSYHRRGDQIKSQDENLETQVTLIVIRMAFRQLNTTALVITALGTIALVVLAIIYG